MCQGRDGRGILARPSAGLKGNIWQQRAAYQFHVGCLPRLRIPQCRWGEMVTRSNFNKLCQHSGTSEPLKARDDLSREGRKGLVSCSRGAEASQNDRYLIFSLCQPHWESFHHWESFEKELERRTRSSLRPRWRSQGVLLMYKLVNTTCEDLSGPCASHVGPDEFGGPGQTQGAGKSAPWNCWIALP